MRSIEYQAGVVRLIDQSRLPHQLAYVECRSHTDIAEAIRSMKVRGAPALGVAAAYGMALGALEFGASETVEDEHKAFRSHMHRVANALRSTRPTAVNLFGAVKKGLQLLEEVERLGVAGVQQQLLALAHRMAEEDISVNQRLSRIGAELLPDRGTVLTHCNTGSLATVGYGTALGVIRAAVELGKELHVLVNETRPYLQGARLTAWELQQDGIPFTLIVDSMAGYFMSRGEVDVVVVGADRVAANGDVANKIGTYTLAVLAQHHGVPFYVAAPISSIDLSVPSGDAIPIEMRPPEEVTAIAGVRIAPFGAPAAHPAFDITPARLITAIVTEAGVLTPPYKQSIRKLIAECTNDHCREFASESAR